MITNKVYVNNKGVGRIDALKETEHVCDYLKLPRKSRLHIRLLTEEMLGMVSEIAGDFDAEFWVEHESKFCRLCLEAEITKMSSEKRNSLIEVSTSGKNAAAKGIMGKLKEIVELYWLGYKDGVEDSTGIDFSTYTGMAMSTMSSVAGSTQWTLCDYRSRIERQKDSGKGEEWDELEKSIVANIADDISIGIKGETVMIVITKEM